MGVWFCLNTCSKNDLYIAAFHLIVTLKRKPLLILIDDSHNARVFTGSQTFKSRQ